MRKAGHELLNKAKAGKNDEFYTRREDVERELRYYSEAFAGKTVLCNCDDFRTSAFSRYFIDNFRRLGLKKIIGSCRVPNDLPLLEKVKSGFY